MKKFARIAIILVAVLVVLGAVGGTVAYVYVGKIAKAAIETVGPQVTKSRVTVGDIRLSLLRGQLEVKAVGVGNPDGFKTPSAFTLGTMRITLKPLSVLSNRILVEEILIDAPEVTYELGLHGSNLGQLQRNVEAFVGPGQPAAEGQPPPASAQTGGGKKVQISDVLVHNGKVHLSATLLGGQAMSLPLPGVHLRDIGKEGEGTSLGEAIATVFKAILSGATDAVTSSGKVLGDGVKAAGGTAKEAGTAVKDGAGKLADGVKGLFGGAKK